MKQILVSLCTIACLTGTTVEARRYVDEEMAQRFDPRSHISCHAGGTKLILSETPNGVSYEYRQLLSLGERKFQVVQTGVITDLALDILIGVLDQVNAVLQLHIHASGVTLLIRKIGDQVHITATNGARFSCRYH